VSGVASQRRLITALFREIYFTAFRWDGINSGIKPLTPGFVRFSLEPQIGSLEYAELRHPTSHGPIKVIIQDKAMEFTVPDGTTAIHGGIEYGAGEHKLEMK
jgi:hypothetical protein